MRFSGRKTLAVTLAALILLVLIVTLLAVEPAPVTVMFDSYERSGSSNYAVLVISNSSDRVFSFTSHNTFPEGTAGHFASLRDGNSWSEPFQNKPSIRGRGQLYSFVMDLPPKSAQNVRVPIDDVLRRVAVPVYRRNMEARKISKSQEWRAKLRYHVRKFLRLENSPSVLIWCDAELQAPTGAR